MNRNSCSRVVPAAALTLFCFVASASETRFGAWTVGPMNNGIYAATINDSGGLLGQYCYRDTASCVWLLTNDVDCEDGSRYSM